MLDNVSNLIGNYCPNCMEKIGVQPNDGSCPYCHRQINVENEPHQLKIGTLLEKRYMIGRVLGQGGFGITYIGLDTRLGMKIAVKEFYPSVWAGRKNNYENEVTVLPGTDNQRLYSKGIERFLDEARSLAQFESMAGVVSVHNFFEENGTAYIIMEFVDGLSLSQVLRSSGAMPYEKAVNLLLPAIKALSAVHKKGIIHRDLSPANMILNRDGVVKILDFGAAREFSGDSEKSLSVYLKPGYTPVEQYQTNGHQGPWTDVYAMAASLYKLVTGTTPESSMDRIFEDELKKPSLINPSITPRQDEAILHGMAVKIENRPQTMDELSEVLSSAMTTTHVDSESQAADSLKYDSLPEPSDAEEDDDATVPSIQNRPVYNNQENRIANERQIPQERQIDQENSDSQDIMNGLTDMVNEYDEENTVPSEVQPAEKVIKAPEHKEKKAKAPKKSDAVSKPEKPNKQTTHKGKKSNKWIIIAAAAVVVIFAAFVVGRLVYIDLFTSDNSADARKSISDGYASYSNYDFNAREAKSIAKNKSVDSLYLYRCTVSDDALAALAKSKTINELSMDSCSGYDGLDELADAASITSLEIQKASNPKDGEDISYDNDFICELPYITELSLNYGEMGNSSQEFCYFPNLTSLKLYYIDFKEQNTEHYIGGSYMNGLQEVRLVECTGLPATSVDDDFAECAYLSVFDVEDCGITDLEGLEKCTNLTQVKVPGNDITSLKGLQYSKNLVYLNTSGNNIESIEPLSNNTALQSLNLNDNAISDISPLASLSELSEISLDNNKISDISVLGGLSKIYNLSISGNGISDISSLAGLSLSNFEADNNSLENLDALSNSLNLNNLSVKNNGLSDIEGIKNSTELYSIDISNNRLTDISALGGNLGNLSSINISHNQISDISAFEGLDGIKYIDVSFNEITDLSPLALSAGNRALFASNNKLTNLKGIENMTELAVLDAASNEISDISAYNVTLSQAAVALEHNQLRDIGALAKNSINYQVLSLYDNPIENYEPLTIDDGSRYAGLALGLLVNGYDLSDEDIQNIAGAGYGDDITFVDTPLDVQNALNKKYTEDSEAVNSYVLAGPAFASGEEADSTLNEYRSSQKGEEDDEESSDTETSDTEASEAEQ